MVRPIDNQDTLLTEFVDSNFISPYASKAGYEDFAESVAFYILRKYFSVGYNLKFSGKTVDLFDESRVEMLEKLDIVEQFVEKLDGYITF